MVGNTHFFIMIYRKAFPKVWSSFKNSNEAAFSEDPGSYNAILSLNVSCPTIGRFTILIRCSSLERSCTSGTIRGASVMETSSWGNWAGSAALLFFDGIFVDALCFGEYLD